MPLPRIAISLLACNDMQLLQPCITSLLASDLSTCADFKIFCIDNNSTDSPGEYLNSLGVPVWVKKNSTNQGIVIPRIEIMKEILVEGFDYTLEIHADMLFPKHWLAPLIAEMDEHTAITMPFILNQPKRLTLPEVEVLVERFRDSGIVEHVRQVHPWLLNNAIIARIGYYDPQFSPQNCEDDDLMVRIDGRGFKTKAVRSSVVVHYGGMTREMFGNPYENFHVHAAKYFAKHGTTLTALIRGFTIHPIITNY